MDKYFGSSRKRNLSQKFCNVWTRREQPILKVTYVFFLRDIMFDERGNSCIETNI